MVKHLRIKFMIVTMSLMLTVFAAFFAISYFYNDYWDVVDTVGTLEWLADSGMFTDEALAKDNELFQDAYSGEDNPIIGVIADANGAILSQQNIGKDKNREVTQETINGLLSQKEDRQYYKSYVYTVKALDDGRKLIVLQDTAMRSGKATRVFGTLVLVLLGVAALAGITFVLSRFITEPARRALEREKQFVSDAGHELKTPIGAISINAQALAMDSDDVHLRNILSETERINRLIEKLLTLSKLEEVPLTQTHNCSMTDIVKEIALTYESVAFEKAVTYQYEIDDAVSVTGDADELRQLAAILIDNAIKHTDSPGLITIRLFRKGSRAVLKVQNTGKGIAEQDIPHIFERFYTRGSARTDNSFGLGLPIAKSIVDRHKGTISVHSTMNEETVFTVIL